MARHTPLPRFRLDPDHIDEHGLTGAHATPAASNRPPQPYQQTAFQLQPQRYQVRFRRSACSDLQNSTIPEGRIYNDNHRRASLFIGRPCESSLSTQRLSTFDEAPSESDYIKLCRQRCQSLYGSLPSSATVSAPVSPLVLTENPLIASDDDAEDDHEDDDDEDEPEEDEEEEEQQQPAFDATSANNFRHSLPDASPAGLTIRNFLKRNKSTTNTNNTQHRLGVPSQSSQSLCSSRSSSSSVLTISPSPLSTFRHFLSLVKLPSSSSSSTTATTTTTKSIISTTSSASTTPHHSSLTTLTGATGGSSTTLDQTASCLSLKKRSTNSVDAQFPWQFDSDKSQWYSADGTSVITLGPIELHNLTYAEHKQLKRIALQRLQTSQYDLGVPIHVPKEEPGRKRKHHFMFRSKSSDKSKEAREAKANGNVFGVALSQCVIDDDARFQEETLSTSPPANMPTASGTNRKDSVDMIVVTPSDRRTSPSGSVSSTHDSGYSVSPASPSSLHISDSDYEQHKLRSLSLEALAENEAGAGVNRCNTLRCYPAKVPELIQNCCDYLEKNALQTVGLFRVGVSKKRLKELKEQVNSSRSLTFDDTTNAHDIAGLIKEFLRELPEPLLTRDLCVPFLNIPSRLNSKDQSRALSYLIALLPSSNRDTLYTLLKFLHHVSLNAQDRCSNDGQVLSAGNKMDAANLAIVFAPTILMDGKAPVISSKDMSVATSADQMEQGKTVLKMMIEQYKELFMVPKDLHDQITLALNDSDNTQLMRALSFKVQQGCGILSMQLDDANERLLMSLDLSPVACETPNATTSIFSSIIPQTNRSSQQQGGPILRRYNHRRNSDFPCSSTHSSRSSEFLQVPMSSSQQRLSNHNQPTVSKLPRVRDIREASMDQIIFRVIEPFSSVISEQQEQLLNSIEPVINISSFDDTVPSPIMRPNTLDIKESPPSPPSSPVLRPAATTTNETTTLREIKPYSRSKTAPLAMSTGTQNFLSVKRREARDLCGSSSNDDSPSPTSGQHSTLV